MNGNGLVNMALISTYNDNVDFGSREAPDTERAAAADRHVRRVQQRRGAAVGAGHAHWQTRCLPHQVNLSWGAATDNVGVTGYEISA